MYALIVLKVLFYIYVLYLISLLGINIVLGSHAVTDTTTLKFEETEQATGTVKIHFNSVGLQYIVSQYRM